MLLLDLFWASKVNVLCSVGLCFLYLGVCVSLGGCFAPPRFGLKGLEGLGVSVIGICVGRLRGPGAVDEGQATVDFGFGTSWISGKMRAN